MRVSTLVGWAGLFSSVVEAAARPLEPVSAWNVDYEESQCTVSRDYGSAEKPITLTLVPSVTGAAMRVLFVRQGKTAITQEPAELDFGPAKALHTYAFVYDVATKHHRVSMINVPMADFSLASSAPFVAIRSPSFDVSLRLEALPQMLVELDKCTKDLREYWNANNVQPMRMAASPDPKLTGVVWAEDYPALALDRGLSGTVGMTLLIDEHGKVADCTVDQPSGVGILDVASCYIYEKRARFSPAQNDRGQSIRSAVSTQITWKIEH